MIFTINSSAQLFKLKQNILISEFEGGSIAMADVDGDSDNDLLFTGSNSIGFAETALYINDGTGKFYTSNNQIQHVQYGDAKFADLDNDGDMDIVVIGNQSTINFFKMYVNDGLGKFTEVNLPHGGLIFARVVVGDVDNDGFQDIIISGTVDFFSGQGICKLFINNGNLTFSEDQNFSVGGTYLGEMMLEDFSGNGFLDLFICGSPTAPGQISKLYVNDGINFNPNSSTFTGVNYGTASTTDIDNDGDLDIFITGVPPNSNTASEIYLNDGAGNFTIHPGSSSIRDLSFSTSHFFDADNDGDNDLLVCGEDNSFQYQMDFYLNDGSGIFTPQQLDSNIKKVNQPAIISGDFDGDNDIDIIIAGQEQVSTRAFTQYLINQTNTPSTVSINELESKQLSVKLAQISFNEVVVEWEKPFHPNQLVVTSISGKKVYSTNLINLRKASIRLDALSPGVYLFTFQGDYSSQTIKYIIQ